MIKNSCAAYICITAAGIELDKGFVGNSWIYIVFYFYDLGYEVCDLKVPTSCELIANSSNCAPGDGFRW
ncbi:MAG TPA: hypothetical protein VE643_02330, partial [Nitrososphaeraceae archaeon]|nr:hypothetical protein [Nitrososphaeraceae archaeon]